MTHKFTILDQVWTLELVPSTSPELMVDGSFRTGACWIGHSKIVLSRDLEFDKISRHLMHELAHAFIASFQITSPETYDEEDLCEFVSIYSETLCSLRASLLEALKEEMKRDD